ncbi:CDP-alcohol phosphatidyltransferase family protein [Qiania dongpingensis]|uniref:Phosphatidylglycerophosphate synthase n=2 Tax=Qiania dongpingensis TaxID=2763669 RepID=A0A7G9G8C2_9FIRM|nr:CDP-alcohol phosphatidyltransferase family protein [Qiania dongpingensis]
MKENGEEYNKIITIPNMMSFFRLALLPVFACIYLNAKTVRGYQAAALVLFISALTDMLDGRIARKFHMISRLGKALDPIADKLTHIVVVFCLCSRYRQVWILLIILAVKESFMGIMGIIYLRKGRMLDGAHFFGKVCTTVLFAVLLVLVFLPQLSVLWVNVLAAAACAACLVTWALYIPVFWKMKDK